MGIRPQGAHRESSSTYCFIIDDRIRSVPGVVECSTVIFLSRHEICIYNCELHGTPGIIFSAVILVVLLYMARERYFP